MRSEGSGLQDSDMGYGAMRIMSLHQDPWNQPPLVSFFDVTHPIQTMVLLKEVRLAPHRPRLRRAKYSCFLYVSCAD